MADSYYVYAFWNKDDSLAYIGKGSGGRFQAQQRRFGRVGVTEGRIIWSSASERRAYRMERALIARHQPTWNKQPGGYGGTGPSKRQLLKNAIAQAENNLRWLKPVHRVIDDDRARPAGMSIQQQVSLYRRVRLGFIKIRNGAMRDLEALDGCA